MQNVETRETLTAIEAVRITMNLLGDIAIPAKYRDALGVIHAAMDNLSVIVGMIEKEKQAIMAEQEAEHADDHDSEGDD